VKTVVAGVDLGKGSPKVCDAAVDLARKTGARLVLVHAVHPPNIQLRGFGFAAAQVRGMLRVLQQRATERLHKLAQRCRGKGVDVSVIEDLAAPAACVLAEALAREADFIVIGSHGHGGAYDLIVGSTAQRIVRDASCPVMLVPVR
jgi:nucleotide-binding universal stress UspA family protein